MTIQNPTYLWALLGLLVPLAIHLWSRKSGKTVKVGSTQWLIASENTRFSSVQFNEVGLFVIRALVVVLVVLILLDLVQNKPVSAGQTAQTWVLTEEALLSDERARPQIDSLVKSGLALHLLKPGMPVVPSNELEKVAVQVKQNQGNAIPINYWSYLSELDVQENAPKKVILLAQNIQKRFQGSRPTLGLEVTWIDVPRPRKSVFLLDALQLPKDSLWLQIGLSDETGTEVIQEKVKRQVKVSIRDLPMVVVKNQQVYFAQAPEENIPIRIPNPQKIEIRYTKPYRLDQQYFKVALEVVGEYMQTEVRVKSAGLDETKQTALLEDNLDWVIFFGKTSDSIQWKGKVGKRQVWLQTSPTDQWFESSKTQTNVYYLRQRPNPEVTPEVLKEGFLEALTGMLFADPGVQQRLAKFDQRQVSQLQALPQKKKRWSDHGLPTQKETDSYHLWLWLALVAGIVTERMMQASREKV